MDVIRENQFDSGSEEDRIRSTKKPNKRKKHRDAEMSPYKRKLI
jgi:hypothetical protein